MWAVTVFVEVDMDFEMVCKWHPTKCTGYKNRLKQCKAVIVHKAAWMYNFYQRPNYILLSYKNSAQYAIDIHFDYFYSSQVLICIDL